MKHRPVFAVPCIAALALLFSGCGGSGGASEGEIERARKEGAQQARQSERIERLREEVGELNGKGGGAGSSGSSSAGASSGSSGGSGGSGAVSSCGDGVSVGPNTSCPFAFRVADAYRSSSASVVDVYSPVTGRTYTMTCTSGSPHVCTGGNDASVYFP